MSAERRQTTDPAFTIDKIDKGNKSRLKIREPLTFTDFENEILKHKKEKGFEGWELTLTTAKRVQSDVSHLFIAGGTIDDKGNIDPTAINSDRIDTVYIPPNSNRLIGYSINPNGTVKFVAVKPGGGFISLDALTCSVANHALVLLGENSRADELVVSTRAIANAVMVSEAKKGFLGYHNSPKGLTT